MRESVKTISELSSKIRKHEENSGLFSGSVERLNQGLNIPMKTARRLASAEFDLCEESKTVLMEAFRQCAALEMLAADRKVDELRKVMGNIEVSSMSVCDVGLINERIKKKLYEISVSS